MTFSNFDSAKKQKTRAVIMSNTQLDPVTPVIGRRGVLVEDFPKNKGSTEQGLPFTQGDEEIFEVAASEFIASYNDLQRKAKSGELSPAQTVEAEKLLQQQFRANIRNMSRSN